MKVAILSESPADEAAVRILIDALLNEATEAAPELPLRSRGWPSVLHLIPSVLKFLHYQTDVEAFAVIVDSDDSPPHQRAHDDEPDTNCRLCQLRGTFASEITKLTPVSGRSSIKWAVGVAVPAIEAWLQCGNDPHVNEATWIRHLGRERITYTRRTLKTDVYGTDRPASSVQMEACTREAARLAGDLQLLSQNFPIGFVALADQVRNWRTVSES